MQPYELTMTQAMEQLETGKLSSVELTRSCLERIAEVESEIHAFITLDEGSALAQAEAADQRRREGAPESFWVFRWE